MRTLSGVIACISHSGFPILAYPSGLPEQQACFHRPPLNPFSITSPFYIVRQRSTSESYNRPSSLSI